MSGRPINRTLRGAELRNDRGTPPRLARVSTDVQRAVDAGEVRLSESSPSATRFRRTGRGSVEVITFKPLSKNPGALQAGAGDAAWRAAPPGPHRRSPHRAAPPPRATHDRVGRARRWAPSGETGLDMIVRDRDVAQQERVPERLRNVREALACACAVQETTDERPLRGRLEAD